MAETLVDEQQLAFDLLRAWRALGVNMLLLIFWPCDGHKAITCVGHAEAAVNRWIDAGPIPEATGPLEERECTQLLRSTKEKLRDARQAGMEHALLLWRENDVNIVYLSSMDRDEVRGLLIDWLDYLDWHRDEA